MERRNFFARIGLGSLGALFIGKSAEAAVSELDRDQPLQLKPRQVQHMVIFDLIYEGDTSLAKKFLSDARQLLSGIEVVQNFQVFDQVSKKNDYHYGFSMVFASEADYQVYNNHPVHVSFVEQRWKKEVSRFMEIDFKVH